MDQAILWEDMALPLETRFVVGFRHWKNDADPGFSLDFGQTPNHLPKEAILLH